MVFNVVDFHVSQYKRTTHCSGVRSRVILFNHFISGESTSSFFPPLKDDPVLIISATELEGTQVNATCQFPINF